MIFKRPYGFLIKHFKLIHLFLTGLYIYLLVKVSSILRFYNGYILGTENRLNAIKITTNYYLIAIILSIIICIVIYALMRYKKKPKLLYFILIILYILISLIIKMSYDGLNQIYIYNNLAIKTQRLYRDILRITTIFQYITIAFTLIRGLGFDIKKFNFKEDIAELDITLNDEEEVELTLGSNEGLFRKIRKKIREYTYYYKENKLIIVVIIAVVAVLGSIIGLLNVKVINKVYNENEKLSTDSFDLVVTNSYITDNNYNNINVSESDKTFVIVKMYIAPHEKGNTLNTGNIILKINNNKYSLDQKNGHNFKDLGTEYISQKILEPKQYIFIFNVPKANLNKNIEISYAEKNRIKLSPKDIDKTAKETTLKLNETLNLEETLLGSGEFKVESMEVKNTFIHDFNYEVNNKTYTSKLTIKSNSNTILNLKINASLPNRITTYELLERYGKIKYKINNEEQKSNLMNNKTPGNYNEGLFLEVDKNLENATNIWIELNIRNKKYIYTLK